MISTVTLLCSFLLQKLGHKQDVDHMHTHMHAAVNEYTSKSLTKTQSLHRYKGTSVTSPHKGCVLGACYQLRQYSAEDQRPSHRWREKAVYDSYYMFLIINLLNISGGNCYQSPKDQILIKSGCFRALLGGRWVGEDPQMHPGPVGGFTEVANVEGWAAGS